MKSFIAICVLFAFLQCSVARFIGRPAEGLQISVVAGREHFDEVKNASLMVVMSPNNGNSYNAIEIEANNIKPGSQYVRHVPNLKYCPLPNVTQIKVYFKTNSTQSSNETYITLDHVYITTMNETSGEYFSRYFYPEDRSRKIYADKHAAVMISHKLNIVHFSDTLPKKQAMN